MAQQPPRSAALLVSPVRRRIVDTLAGLPQLPAHGTPSRATGLTAAEVGERLGLHVTSARFHLEQLADAGVLAASFHRHGTGRPQKRYAVLPDRAPVQQQDDPYRMLAELLTEALAQPDGGALSPEDAGARWALAHVRQLSGSGDAELPQARTPGEWLAKVGRLLDLLEAWGYEPSVRTTDQGRTAEVALARCPFLSLAESHTEVVCAAHVGLIRGALDVFGEPDAEVHLQPFALPGICLARLTTLAALPRHPEESAGV
ncbi:helix-turn-helix domain-containing protein [Knoellia sp. 3-2P3]|nr:helix-turn-helix domain-containing protein [Knoellia sp. 3-2P3]MDF2092127.1 helix-turn-helix domain-containing protein [Knoellia sp. 3-2P3]